MSDINLDFTVQQSNIQIVTDTNPIVITPTDVQLTLYTGGFSIPGGNVGELQYNLGGVLGGIPNTNYNGSNLYLGNISNLYIGGGINGYFLQTDGAGNLTWAAGGGGGGNGSPGGSNTQIQFNNAGVFGGNVGFTFNKLSGTVNIPGGLGVTTTITAQNIESNASIIANTINANANISTLNLFANNITANSNINANIANVNRIIYNNDYVFLGNSAGNNTGGAPIAIGKGAAQNSQSSLSIAIGVNAGRNVGANYYNIAIGQEAAYTGQSNGAIAIGYAAGYFGQGKDSVAIGNRAGVDAANSLSQANNTIVLNATGLELSGNANANAFYVKPIRNDNTSGNGLYDNNTTGEISYGIINAATANTVVNNAQPNITSVGTLANLTVSGSTTIQQAFEKVNANGTGSTGNLTYYLGNGAIELRTANATANFTLDFRYNIGVNLTNVMSNGQSITCSFINTNGPTAYIPTAITVDGSAATVIWSGTTGSALPGTPTGKDLYTFNIIKNAGNFTVFSSRVGFV